MLLKSSLLIVAIAIWSINSGFALECPVTKEHGVVYPLPNASFQADKLIKYKILFDITGQPKT